MGAVLAQARELFTKAAARSGFDKFKSGARKAQRKQKLNKDKLEALLQAWDNYEFRYSTENIHENKVTVESTYQDALKLVRDLEYDAKDVEHFCKLLTGFEHENLICEKSGIFLSALINSGRENNYHISIKHLNYTPWLLGYRNRKNIVVDGDCGEHFGYYMSGSAEIHGKVGGDAAYRMKEGLLIIHGDVGDDFGRAMSGGLAIVKGNGCGGREMTGGKIVIGGNAGDIGEEIQGGEIEIHGNVTGKIGHDMKGGRIEIRGDVHDVIGTHMEGGELHIWGSYPGFGEDMFIGGVTVYHNGRPVIKLGNVEADERIQAMINAWEDFTLKKTIEESYSEAWDTVKELDYTRLDVELFSLKLRDMVGGANFQDKAGLFLSALVNNSEDQDKFTIWQAWIRVPINYLGYMNTKNLSIEGHAGHSCGMRMDSGNIRVVNFGEKLGTEMKGGEIFAHVAREAYDAKGGDYIGFKMEGGRIQIAGYPGFYVGEQMKGGEIHLNEGYGHLGKVEAGKIYYRRRLEIDK